MKEFNNEPLPKEQIGSEFEKRLSENAKERHRLEDEHKSKKIESDKINNVWNLAKSFLNELPRVEEYEQKDISKLDVKKEFEKLKKEVSELKETIASMQTEFSEALKSMQEEFTQTLTEALKPVDEVAEKSEEAEPEPTDDDVEEEVEEEVEADKSEDVPVEAEEETEEEPIVEKGESKAEPVHDNIEANKSKPMNIYEALGRNPDGTRKL